MKIPIALAFLTLTTTLALAQSHGHINAGAIDSNGSGAINAGDKLFMYFEHGTQLTTLAFNSGANVPGADGYLWNGNTTLTALRQSSFPSRAPDYNSLGALSGSFLTINLVSVTGPVGTKLAFYDAGGADPLWVYQICTGFLAGNGEISLTELQWFEGSPEDGIPSDPYGHIHGRTFGIDTAGSFTATWILKDTQSTASGLLDSDPFTSSFTAAPVPEPATWLLLAAGALFLAQRAIRQRWSSSIW
jgi:hypothetical protein